MRSLLAGLAGLSFSESGCRVEGFGDVRAGFALDKELRCGRSIAKSLESLDALGGCHRSKDILSCTNPTGELVELLVSVLTRVSCCYLLRSHSFKPS